MNGKPKTQKQTRSRERNGNGSIYYDDKRDRWIAEIQWTDKNDTKHRKKFADKKKSAVKSRLDDFRKQLLLNSSDIADDDVIFQEYADNWLNTILKHSLKPTSFMRKEVTLKYQVYPHIGDIPMNRLTHDDIQNMVNALAAQGLSYSTIKKAFEAVNGCLANYRVRTSTYFNPCEGVVLPSKSRRETSDIVFFDEKQRKLIREEALRKYKNGKPVYRLGQAIVILMYSGLRVGELLALTWDDIDFDDETISVNKNAVVTKTIDGDESHYRLINQRSTKTQSGNRIIPMTSHVKTALKEIQEFNGSHQHVMSSSTGAQITPRNINRMFHSILTKTGIAKSKDDLLGVHSLRHTFASMLFQNGSDTKTVSELLGHSDTKITENIYIHLIQQQKVKAIKDIDKFTDE